MKRLRAATVDGCGGGEVQLVAEPTSHEFDAFCEELRSRGPALRGVTVESCDLDDGVRAQGIASALWGATNLVALRYALLALCRSSPHCRACLFHGD